MNHSRSQPFDRCQRANYDAIELLPPTKLTEAGYRLYDDLELAQLQSIPLFRELELLLRDIKRVLDNPSSIKLPHWQTRSN